MNDTAFPADLRDELHRGLGTLGLDADALAPRLFGAFAFLGLWGAIAKAAHDGGWRVLFGIAIGMIAVRLFIVYVELFGGLALTGIGLIVGGILLIGLTLAWAKLMKRTPA